MESPLRSHTFAWRDTTPTSVSARRLSGREYLEALRDKTVSPPPFVAALDFALTAIGDGRVTFTFAPQEYMQNGIGLLHGGVAATILDTAAGCACMTVVPDEKVAITLDLQVRYFKPLTLKSGQIRCEGLVLNLGRTTVTAEGRLFDGAGRLCGHATSTLAIVEASGLR